MCLNDVVDVSDIKGADLPYFSMIDLVSINRY